MKLRGIHVRRIAGFLLAVVLLAVLPLAVSTPLRLWWLDPPPVIVLEGGQVAGQMTLADWAEAFWGTLFNFAPPETFFDLAGFSWPAAKGFIATLALVVYFVALTAVGPVKHEDDTVSFVIFAIGACAFVIYALPGRVYRPEGEAMIVALLVYAIAVAGTGWLYGRRIWKAVG